MTVEIGQRPIIEVARELGLAAEEIEPYGRDKAKVVLSGRPTREADRPKPRLVLVSAITPTPAGEGKTTTSIGLADGLRRRGHRVCVALREPSLGPCFGMKGGGTGGGASQLSPAVDINLHFTGDFHAVTAAHNLLAAAIDNHLHRGNSLGIDPRRILWRRVMDVNDRALRNLVIGLGGPTDGVSRESGFDITAASEVMAMLCLANDAADMRERLDRTLIGFTYKREPVTAGDLGVSGAMMALLRDALKPNLVQTLEGTPALVHGGPFANIAHGCNSVMATTLGLSLADWVVTEAGFGFDLGAEKFFDIKCASAGLDAAAVVLVVTARALKMHGGKERAELDTPDAQAVKAGLPNMEKHLENIAQFGERPIVAVNRFATDSEEELAVIQERCAALGVPVAINDHFVRGGEGTLELADAVVTFSEDRPTPFRPLYDWSAPVEEKIKTVAQKMYGARDVYYEREAKRDLAAIAKYGYADLPICIAKTHSSLSDDPKRRGRPSDFEVTVSRVHINAGAGFLVVLTGDIVRMPGLPKRPRAERVELVDGEIQGLLT